MDVEHLPDGESEDTQGGGGFQSDLLGSYLAFASRAIRKRSLLAASVFVLLAGLTIAVLAVWPRTYHCETKLMAQYNWALEYTNKSSTPTPFDGAANQVMRQENLINIAKRAGLADSWSLTRSPVLRLKDRIVAIFRGDPSEAEKLDLLVGVLESRLSISVSDGILTVGVDWPDPRTAVRIVDVARDTFLESRHTAEISTIQEKISILDGHATRLRGEIEDIASDLQTTRIEKVTETGKTIKEAKEADAKPAPIAPSTVVRRSPRPAAESPEEVARAKDEALRAKEDAERIKEELDAKKRTIGELEADRGRRLVEAQAKLTELGYKYTQAHPAVLQAQQVVGSLSHEGPRVTAMRDEVVQLESQLRQLNQTMHDASSLGTSAAAGGGGAAAALPPTPDPLPTEILRALDDSMGADPVARAQLQTAVSKYTSLRTEITNARVDLDTAQAAFAHRYQVVVPAQTPSKPTKPNPPKVLGIGLSLALLIALIGPVLAELRQGRIIERWQVYHLNLPLLAELRFPAGPSD